MALRDISKRREELGGSGFAIAGVVLSGLVLLMLPIWAAMLMPALARARDEARAAACISNVHNIGLALAAYSVDHDGPLPGGDSWCDELLEEGYLPDRELFVCPQAPQTECAYALNAQVAGQDLERLQPDTVVLFEADLGWNGTGGPEDAVQRHSGGVVVLFADNSVQRVAVERLSSLRWTP